MSAVPQAREPLVLRDDRDAICTLTMNRPQQMNLLTSDMLDALQSAFDSLVADRKIRVVVLAGAGKRLCAGDGLERNRALEGQPENQKTFRPGDRVRAVSNAPARAGISPVRG